jgi:hypothetical protein
MRWLAPVFVLFVGACDVPRYQKAASDFGRAEANVTSETRKGYDLVESTVREQQVLALSMRSGPIDRNPESLFTPFLTEEDIQIRGKLLDALDAYATLLTQITGQPDKDVDTQAAKLGADLKNLAHNDRLRHSLRQVRNVPDDALNGVATFVDFVADRMIEHRIAQNLPGIVRDMQPKLEQFVAMFADEIGGPPDSSTPGGLRGKLGRTYDDLEMAQVKIVDASGAGSKDRYEAVQKMADLIAARHSADAGLERTQSALRKLIGAHRALLEVDKTPARFNVEVAAVWADVTSANEFYANLSKK